MLGIRIGISVTKASLMKIQDLGALDGPILLFGGIYSNLEALTALWSWADQADIPITNRICTGDMAAYCADARACIEFMRDAGSPVLAGNCEQQLASGADDCGCGFEDDSTCSLLSRGWYAHALTQMDEGLRSYMTDLPDRILYEHHGKRYVVIHGGASDISQFLWTVTPIEQMKVELNLLRDQVGLFDAVIAGHSGIPFERQIDHVNWINAGAIGMPAHDLSPQTHFAVLDEGNVTFHRLNYDAHAAAQKMTSAGLAQGYHKTLLSGIWPSEDTLPPELHHSAAKG